MKKQRFMKAKEAADELGIAAATLYSYVSRGLVRSETTGEGKRDRRYSAEDILGLKERKEMRRNPRKAAEGALNWGTPLLESAITLIDDGRLYYRGYDAVELATTRSVEEVAMLIWNGALESPRPRAANLKLPAEWGRVRQSLGGLSVAEQFQVFLPLAEHDDSGAFHLRRESVQQTGWRILQMMTSIASGSSSSVTDISGTLATHWAPKKQQAHRLITAALVLAADHELNVSTFTVRCVASAGSTPYSALAAGLAALRGTKHGGYTERVERLMVEIGRPERAYEVLSGRLRRGEIIPGFHHELYPDGDPRGRALVEMTAEAFPRAPAVRLAMKTQEAMVALTGDHPTIDFGLVLLTRALGLPEGSALTLFALGRTIGWVGHLIEQYEVDRMIRPRARYTGRPTKSNR